MTMADMGFEIRNVPAKDLLDQATAELTPACTHELIEQQAYRAPDALAVVHGQSRLTYDALNRRANKLARRLRMFGVEPDVLAAVCLDRSPELVIALLSVWKAGGAYVPLDPAYPAERLSFMARDSKARVLITQAKYRDVITCQPSTAVICLDSDWPAIDGEPDENLPAVAGPQNLAYVMYTSGSTGIPKGAMIEHRGLVNYLCWARSFYAVEPGLSAPVHSSVSFDLTVTSLYTPLVAGGYVELIDDDLGAQKLLAALRRQGDRSLIKITPAHLELLNSQLKPAQARNMARVLVIGGENLLSESLRLWRGLEPAPRLINEYGPTETVVGCCVHEVVQGDPVTGSVSIGRPIANMQMHVLDEAMRPVPAGQTGELYIGGIGVGRGYLNNPALSAEKFLPDPFSKRPGARLYRTGDHGAWRSDGVLEYMGRIDDQVKIRGFRIELGEVEATIAAHPDVRSCATVVRADGDHKQLVAYAVLAAGADGPASLRDFVRSKLPAHMVPARILPIESLPLTPNGKVDRKRLAALDIVESAAPKPVRPRTATEKTMLALWQDVLRLDDIGLNDDFFDLSGDSLSAVRLLLQLQTSFGVTVELAQLFEQPTISGLSQRVDALIVTSGQAEPSSEHEAREEFDL